MTGIRHRADTLYGTWPARYLLACERSETVRLGFRKTGYERLFKCGTIRG